MARKKSNHLVCEYLEAIDRKMLIQYQDIVREFIKGRHGIYALCIRARGCTMLDWQVISEVGSKRIYATNTNHHGTVSAFI